MTFIIKTRGAGGLIVADYRCPEHGVFEATVERTESGDAPDEQPCPEMVTLGGATSNPPAPGSADYQERLAKWIRSGSRSGYAGVKAPCVHGRKSPWTISAPRVHTQFVVTASQGKSAPKPHRDAMDTRMLAEGRKKDFRQQRQQVREGLRQKRVSEMLK